MVDLFAAPRVSTTKDYYLFRAEEGRSMIKWLRWLLIYQGVFLLWVLTEMQSIRRMLPVTEPGGPPGQGTPNVVTLYLLTLGLLLFLRHRSLGSRQP